MVRSGEAAARLAVDEARLLQATLRSSPLETVMRLRALEEIALALDTGALVDLATQISDSARDQGAKIAWI